MLLLCEGLAQQLCCLLSWLAVVSKGIAPLLQKWIAQTTDFNLFVATGGHHG
jgi:hypothetical protein